MQDKPGIHLSVIIPAYNEENRLPKTLDAVLDYLGKQSYTSEVLIVDDGSKDKTIEIAKQRDNGRIPLRVIPHPDGQNHGKGATVRLGMLKAAGAYRLFMDADNSTTVEHVERLWPYFNEGYDVVIGSRGLKESVIPKHQSWYRELAGDVGNWIIRVLAVPGIHDTQAGFKMLTARSAEDIFPRLTIDRWGFDVEVLAVARYLNYKVKEVPIRWVDAPNSKLTLASYFEVFAEVGRVRRNVKRRLYDTVPASQDVHERADI
jgi:dolichyl-phosphate beta-glucosyltransferase